MQQGRVTAQSGLRLRRAPRDGEIIRVLAGGTLLDILGGDAWLHVRVGGDEGFVSAQFVEFVSAENPAAPKAVITIRPYQNSAFTGNPIQADVDFEACLNRLNSYAQECGVTIHVTSSFRTPNAALRGTIVPPAERSNHLIGHAIDMNLQSASGFFPSAKLRRANLPNLPEEIRRFLEKVRADPELRWGGDFITEDPVHIDDGLNVRHPERWAQKFAAL